MEVTVARALIVEGDEAIRRAVSLALRDEGYDVCAEEDGAAALAAATRFRPDIAIVNVRLPPGPDGFVVARSLLETSDLPVVFLSAADDVDARLAGFAIGADDYMVKPFSMAELLARLRAILRRAGRLPAAVWQVGDLVVDDAAHVAKRNGIPVELTPTEFELLAVLGRHRSRLLSKVDLLSMVWGYDAYDPNVVEVHISALRAKLEAHGRRLIHTVRGAGYVLRP